MKKEIITVPQENIANSIFLIRGKKVMFDRDLARLYGVETKALNQAVKRNLSRFPNDFMFQLTNEESIVWQDHRSRSQFVTLNRGSNIKYNPCVFTEQGVAMLSSVLKSKKAVQVNIQIIRTFTKLRQMLLSNEKLLTKIEALEQKYDRKIAVVFEAIRKLVAAEEEEEAPKIPIGFSTK